METILVVEDEKRIRDIVRDYFTAHGLGCDLARDGAEALDLLRDHDYDAILLDVFMPNLDGFQVCRAVRQRSQVPILFLTALGNEEDMLRGYALGCDDYVTKPFSLAVLLAKTRALIRRGRELGLFTTIERGIFADVKRPKDGGKGLAGVVVKGAEYFQLKLANGKSVNLLPWRIERRFVELKKIIDGKTLEDVSTFRFATFSCGGDGRKLLARELDLAAWLSRSAVSRLYAVGSEKACNVIFRLAKARKGNATRILDLMEGFGNFFVSVSDGATGATALARNTNFGDTQAGADLTALLRNQFSTNASPRNQKKITNEWALFVRNAIFIGAFTNIPDANDPRYNGDRLAWFKDKNAYSKAVAEELKYQKKLGNSPFLAEVQALNDKYDKVRLDAQRDRTRSLKEERQRRQAEENVW